MVAELKEIFTKIDRHLYQKLKNFGVPLDDPKKLMEHIERISYINDLSLELREKITKENLEEIVKKSLQIILTSTKEITIAQIKLRSESPNELIFSPYGRYMFPLAYYTKDKDTLEERVFKESAMNEVDDLENPLINPFFWAIKNKKTAVYRERDDYEAYLKGMIKKPGFGKRNRDYYKKIGIKIPEDKEIQSFEVPIVLLDNVVGIIRGSNHRKFGNITEEEIKYVEKVSNYVGVTLYLYFDYNNLKNLAEKMGGKLANLIIKNPQLLEGTEKFISCVFLDIENFTPYSKKKNPKEVMNLLRNLWKEVDPIIIESKGIIADHPGDGAFFFYNGIPDLEQENHVYLAISTTLKIFEKINQSKIALEGLKLKAGINSGPAYVGNISHSKLEFTAIGHTVNYAKRLEEKATGGTILVGKNTYNLVKNKYRFKELIVEIAGNNYEAYKLEL